MEKRAKELAKSPARVRDKFYAMLPKVQNGDFQQLDIQSIIGKPGLVRRRIGDYRVLLMQRGKQFVVVHFKHRGDVYKNLKKM